MAPLEVDQITQQDKAVAAPKSASAGQESFLQIDQPDVALVTWKQAENGDGTILRLVEIGGHESEVNVEVPKANLKSVWATDALERNQRQLGNTQHSFHLSIHPYEIETVRLENLTEAAAH
jgi:alpha-mannosidase